MNKVNLAFSIIKLMLSGTCYGLVLYYFTIANVLCEWSESRWCFVRNQIVSTTCVAFTFIIEPAMIVAAISTSEHHSKTVLGELFSLAGFLSYVISASLILKYSINVVYLKDLILREQYLITGGLYVATAAAYLLHFIYAVYRRRKSRN